MPHATKRCETWAWTGTPRKAKVAWFATPALDAADPNRAVLGGVPCAGCAQITKAVTKLITDPQGCWKREDGSWCIFCTIL